MGNGFFIMGSDGQIFQAEGRSLPAALKNFLKAGDAPLGGKDIVGVIDRDFVLNPAAIPTPMLAVIIKNPTPQPGPGSGEGDRG